MNTATPDADAADARQGPRLKRLVLLAVRTILLAYLVICVFMYFYQYKLIYVPHEALDGNPSTFGMSYVDVALTTGDGVRISAWYVEPDEPRGVLILCHGNAGNMSHRLDIARAFYDCGLSVLLFDYRGYGRSKGSPDEAGTYADAEAAWQYLAETKGWPADRVIVYGESIGGAVAVELASRHTPAALIVESTFTALYDVAKTVYPFLPIKLLMRVRYESKDKIDRVSCMKLFIHSTEDELVPYELGRALFELADRPKQFLTTHGGHNDGGFLTRPETIDAVCRFVDQVLAADALD